MRAFLNIKIYEKKQCGLFDLLWTYIEGMENTNDMLNKDDFIRWIKSKNLKQQESVIQSASEIVDKYNEAIEKIQALGFEIMPENAIDFWP